MFVDEPLALDAGSDPAIFNARDAVSVKETGLGRRPLRAQHAVVPDRRQEKHQDRTKQPPSGKKRQLERQNGDQNRQADIGEAHVRNARIEPAESLVLATARRQPLAICGQGILQSKRLYCVGRTYRRVVPARLQPSTSSSVSIFAMR